MRRVYVCVAALCALIFASPASAFERPSPGAAGIGDRLFPTLGNGGYDVEHYELDLRYETASPSQSIDGTVTILAKATQSLSRFNLDFGGDSVGRVTVNGLPAKFSREGWRARDHAASAVAEGASVRGPGLALRVAPK